MFLHTNYYRTFIYILLVNVTSSYYHVCCQVSADDHKGNDEHGLTAAELIQLRGFKAENHYFTTSDGYILNIIKATNPLIINQDNYNKQVLLFVHGGVTNAKCFIVNSIGAFPEDYSHLNASEISDDDLIEKFASNPNSKSLVFLALNFGHEVWLLNRRGTMYSQGHIDPAIQHFPKSKLRSKGSWRRSNGSSSRRKHFLRANKHSGLKPNPLAGALKEYYELLSDPNFLITQGNPKYWNYTVDTEVLHDIPETVEYVLKQTGREKLTYIGHSLGGALPLLALYRKPELSEKFNQLVLWAPGVEQGAVPADELPPLKRISLLFEKPFKVYSGPVSPTLINPLLQSLAASLCETELTAKIICAAGASFMFGDGGNQQNIFPGLLSAAPDTVGSHELAQLIEDFHSHTTNFYNYPNHKMNQIAYGQPKPPRYDFSKLTFNDMFIFYGKTDGIVQYQSIQQLLNHLTCKFLYSNDDDDFPYDDCDKTNYKLNSIAKRTNGLVPVKSRFFNDTGLYWNHISFLIHKEVSTYLNLPSLKYIESVS